jgi:hypothetical protein
MQELPKLRWLWLLELGCSWPWDSQYIVQVNKCSRMSIRVDKVPNPDHLVAKGDCVWGDWYVCMMEGSKLIS